MNYFIEFCKKIKRYLEKSPKNVPITLSGFFLILISCIDYLVSPEIVLSVFYLLPISLNAWFVSQKAGFFTAVLSAIAYFLTNLNLDQKESYLLIHVWNTGIWLIFFSIISYLLVKLRRVMHQAQEAARIDSLTGIANRRLFFELARLELKKSHRYRHPLTIIQIDIDDFQLFQNSRVYRAGEKLLKTVAGTLKNYLRETDIIARIGDDEFVILLPGSGYEPARVVINRVQDKLLESLQNNSWSITFSISAVTFINPPNSVDVMLQRTDHLMYLVKNNGEDALKHITSV
ncbi:MAG: GGDEF domain-containing protein [Coleofasciculus sp. S288]|nr:GGDEF domain-containing protein [Coleofasciculus sp. S288]